MDWGFRRRQIKKLQMIDQLYYIDFPASSHVSFVIKWKGTKNQKRDRINNRAFDPSATFFSTCQNQQHVIICKRQRISFDLEGAGIRQHFMDSLLLRHARIVTGHQR